jgi:hypothetical protein
VPNRVKSVRRSMRVRKLRRTDIVPDKLNRLDLDAPKGRYNVDALTSILQGSGWLTSGQKEYSGKYLQPYQIIRWAVNFAGMGAHLGAANERTRPQKLKYAKLFFDNLRNLQKSISFFCKVDPNELFAIISKNDLPEEVHPGRAWDELTNDTGFLIESLENCNRQVESFLGSYTIIKRQAGNVDWLGSDFVRIMAGAGRRHMKGDRILPPLQSTDVKLFSTLLAAGWTDLKFPLTDHRGNPLEPLDLFFETRVKSMIQAKRL